MKKLIILVIVFCIGAFSAHVFGQQENTQKNEKKGGFAVGGYDNAKKTQEVKKRSVDIGEEAEVSEKAAESVAPPPPPPPVPEQAAAPVPDREKDRKIKDKENKGNAYGKDKSGLEGKDSGQARSQDAKAKQKSKNAGKSKAKK